MAEATVAPLEPAAAASGQAPSAPRARTGRNVVANFAGRMSTVVLGVAVVPVYLRALGPEGYGLIGLFAALQTIIGLFDFGLGTTLNRQLALDAAMPGRERHMRDFTRTVEAVYWATTLVLAVAWVALAPVVASRWLHASDVAAPALRLSVALMGVAAALQFPNALYGGGLLGLQRQVTYNVALIAAGTIRSLGAVVVLLYVSRTVEAFFAWQVCVSLAQSVAGQLLLWRALPSFPARPRVHWDHLRGVWRFAAGTGSVTLIGVVLSQIDKVLLTRLLPLSQFGYYALAGVLGSSVYLLAMPLFMAYFPRLSQLIARGDEVALSHAYHEGCQFVSAITVPTAVVAAFFSRQVIQLWTHDASVAASAWTVASLLIVSNALAALYGLPYTLQLALGWTRLAIRTTGCQLLLGAPLIYFATARFGPTGAAGAWVAMNAGALAAFVVGMHRRLLPGEAGHWARHDVAAPVLASLAVAALGRWLLPPFRGVAPLVLYIGVVSLGTLVAAIVATPAPRRVALRVAARALARLAVRERAFR